MIRRGKKVRALADFAKIGAKGMEKKKVRALEKFAEIGANGMG